MELIPIRSQRGANEEKSFHGNWRRLPTRCTVIVLLFLSYKSAWSETDHLIPAHPVPEDYYAALTYLLKCHSLR